MPKAACMLPLPHSMPPSTYMRSTCSAWRPLFSHPGMRNAIGICEVHSLKSQCYRTKYIHSVHRTIKKSDPVCLFLETFLDHLTLAKVLYLLCSRLGWGSRCSSYRALDLGKVSHLNGVGGKLKGVCTSSRGLLHVYSCLRMTWVEACGGIEVGWWGAWAWHEYLG